MKQIRFSFDWGTCKCLWDNEGIVNYNSLEISDALCAKLDKMGEEMQSALEWADPTTCSPWSEEHKADFVCRAKIAYEQICQELGDLYEVSYNFTWFEH